MTHQHPDHLDLDRLPALLAANPAAQLIVDIGSVGPLADTGMAHRVVRPGERLELAGATIDVIGGDHGVIHPDIPVVPNNGYLIDGGAGTILYGWHGGSRTGAVTVIGGRSRSRWDRAVSRGAVLLRVRGLTTVPRRTSRLVVPLYINAALVVPGVVARPVVAIALVGVPCSVEAPIGVEEAVVAVTVAVRVVTIAPTHRENPRDFHTSPSFISASARDNRRRSCAPKSLACDTRKCRRPRRRYVQ